MKRSVQVVLAGATLAAAAAVPMAVASAEDPAPAPPSCTITYGAVLKPSLSVVNGQVVCLAGTTVNGNVSVSPGGALKLDNGYVSGSIVSTQAAYLWVCGTTVRGSVTAQSPTGFVRIGDLSNDDGLGCGGNNIRGSVSVLGGMGGFEVGANQIGANLTVNDNVGTSHVSTEYEIEGNYVGGALTCLRNQPLPEDDGKPNTVVGVVNCALEGPPT